MTNNQTISIFIGLILYLFILAVFLNYAGKDLNVEYDQQGHEINKTFIGNIVTAIGSFPWWLNTIFITIPFALLIWGAILLLLHG